MASRLTPDQFMAQTGLEAYRVGGSVRDELLGRESKDRDYMVRGADLPAIQAALLHGPNSGLVKRVTPLKLRDGRQAGWRTTVRGMGLLEIVMPRTEVSTGPGHRDFEIVTDPDLTLKDDAIRRDFTFNALYRCVRTGDLMDPTGFGEVDLRLATVNTTHKTSFRDDPLRTLRALRFVSQLDFSLSHECRWQMEFHAQAVDGLTDKGVSGTALEELCKLLMGQQPGKALRYARDTGVLAVLLPELAPMLGYEQRSRYHTKTTDEHTFDAVQAAANMHHHAPLHVRLALLFHDAGKPKSAWLGPDGNDHYYSPEDSTWLNICYCDDTGSEGYRDEDMDAFYLGYKPRDHEEVGADLARTALMRLNASLPLRQKVDILIRRHMLPLHENVKPFKVRKWRAELGDDMLRDLITHRLADVIGKGGDISEACEVLEWIESERLRAREMGVPESVRDLKINGHDLMAAGLEGPDIGRVLRAVLHEVLAQPKMSNDRDWQFARAEALR